MVRQFKSFFMHIALLVSWMVLFVEISIAIQGTLAPWSRVDGVAEFGTLQHSINTFFHVGMGTFVLAVIMMVACMVLGNRIYTQNREAMGRHVAYNWLMIIALPLAYFVGITFNWTLLLGFDQSVLPDSVGYLVSILPFILTFGAYGIWYRAQLEMAFVSTGEVAQPKRQANVTTQQPQANMLVA